MTRVVFCAKSAWHPSIRREHELARLCAAAGHEVAFVERPADLRMLSTRDRGAWLRRLARPATTNDAGVEVVARSTVVPGHRGALAGQLDAQLLRLALARHTGEVVVASVPWEWPAIARGAGARRVFDCADDWSQVMPRRRDRLRALYRRVAREADAIICASERLGELFAPRKVTVVRNGTPTALLASPATRPPATCTIAYAGTLSERFDCYLVSGVLDRLPEWRLELYGPCQYAGRGDRPGGDMVELLRRWPNRVAWHGPVAREELADRLDAADVLVIPHRPHGAVGGDAMKFYDYAARQRPIVTSSWTPSIEEIVPPHTTIASDAASFAHAIREASHEPASFAPERGRWARSNSWPDRWPAWVEAAIG